MSIYQSNQNAAPDSEFEPGLLHHVVVGNAARLLDPRRTPVTVVEVRAAVGTFVVRIDDFEDRGARWEVPLEQVDRYQFTRGCSRAAPAEIERFRDAIDRFDRPLAIPCDAEAAARTATRLEEAAAAADRWVGEQSAFLARVGHLPSAESRRADPLLIEDLRRFMAGRGVEDLEEAFASQFVSNPSSGELVKGHRIVVAELGLVPFEGTVVRTPSIFDGAWSRPRRAEHIVSRIGFVRSLFRRTGHRTVSLYRGLSTETPLEAPANRTFVSTTFSRAVAQSHFDCGSPDATRILIHQRVPVERLFMTYHETAAMNEVFREAEAVLLFDGGNLAF
jgi:hypothetical protein